MEKRGMSVGEMGLQLVKAVDEMTLPMIEMYKELQSLKAADSRRK